MSEKKRVGVFWGAFDPPTIAHTLVIFSALQLNYVEEIYVVVNTIKSYGTKEHHKASTTVDYREQMLKLSLEDLHKSECLLGKSGRFERGSDLTEAENWLSKIKIVPQKGNEYSYSTLKQGLVEKFNEQKMMKPRRRSMAVEGAEKDLDGDDCEVELFAIVGADSFVNYHSQCKDMDKVLVVPRCLVSGRAKITKAEKASTAVESEHLETRRCEEVHEHSIAPMKKSVSLTNLPKDPHGSNDSNEKFNEIYQSLLKQYDNVVELKMKDVTIVFEEQSSFKEEGVSKNRVDEIVGSEQCRYISSTKARNAVSGSDESELRQLVMPSVYDFIRKAGLYVKL